MHLELPCCYLLLMKRACFTDIELGMLTEVEQVVLSNLSQKIKEACDRTGMKMQYEFALQSYSKTILLFCHSKNNDLCVVHIYLNDY